MGATNPLPVVLASTQITFAASDPAGTTRNSNPGIRNTEPTGVLIDRLVLRCTSTSAGVANLQLRWRNEPITNGFVVTAGMTYPLNRQIEASGLAVLQLARPFYLPPGEFIDVSVRNDLFPLTAATFNLFAIGKQAHPPRHRWVPYLSTFITAAYLENGGGVIADASTPNDLGNPFNGDLYVERLVGRVIGAVAATGPYTDGSPTPSWLPFALRLFDQRDNALVANPIALPLVFDGVNRSWLMYAEMEAKGFLRAEFDGIANVAGSGAYLRAVIGLVGYRRIA